MILTLFSIFWEGTGKLKKQVWKSKSRPFGIMPTSTAGSTPLRRSGRRSVTPTRLGHGDGWDEAATSKWTTSENHVVEDGPGGRPNSRLYTVPTPTSTAESDQNSTPKVDNTVGKKYVFVVLYAGEFHRHTRGKHVCVDEKVTAAGRKPSEDVFRKWWPCG
jgi:hypothetical protein